MRLKLREDVSSRLLAEPTGCATLVDEALLARLPGSVGDAGGDREGIEIGAFVIGFRGLALGDLFAC